MNLDLGDTRQLIDLASTQGMLRNQLAYVLATAFWETAKTMKPVREAYWCSEEWRAENLSYYPWYGRGYVQLTWESNYRRADDELHLGGSLVADADLALDASIAGMVIITGMTEGWFTGKKLSDYITLSKSDFYNARRIVNGTDRAQDIANLAAEYDRDLLAEGYGVETSPDAAIAALEARVAALEAWAQAFPTFTGTV